MDDENKGINFIEKEINKKFIWKWNIEINDNILCKYKYLNINKTEKNECIIESSRILLLYSNVYFSESRKGYVNCDILVGNVDEDEKRFFNSLNNFIMFVVNNFKEKYRKNINKNIKFINPLEKNKINTYLAITKNNHILTDIVNIKNDINKIKIPSKINIFPKFLIKYLKVENNNIYVDIILNGCYIYTPDYKIKKNEIFNNYDECKIFELPNEIIAEIMLLICENKHDLNNLIFTCKTFFKIFMNNYYTLFEDWVVTSNYFRHDKWTYCKFKCILDF